jgi:adenosylcobinamide-GDP ribazoletransferase
VNPLRPFAVALTFLTRTPIKLQDVQEADLGRSITCFPAVGLVLGVVLAGAERLGRGHLSQELIAVGVIALLVALTGGLHLDGLADVFDGLAGSRGDRERMLVIMRDSRIGALGGAAMLLAILGKVFATLELQRVGTTWAIFVFPVAARWAVAPLVIFFPYARKEGLGKAFNGHGRLVHFAVATFIMGAVLAIAGLRAIAPTVAALVATLGIALWLQRRLGGLTGDVYGASIELSELTFLVVATVGR